MAYVDRTDADFLCGGIYSDSCSSAAGIDGIVGRHGPCCEWSADADSDGKSFGRCLLDGCPCRSFGGGGSCCVAFRVSIGRISAIGLGVDYSVLIGRSIGGDGFVGSHIFSCQTSCCGTRYRTHVELCPVVGVVCCLVDADRLQEFFVWGMGSFSHVSWESLPCMAVGTLIGIAAACLLVKPLDALMLGDIYARNCGVPVGAVRRAVMLSVGILAAVVTAFCGPIAFVGMAVPQMTRLLLPSAAHRLLLPVCMLLGAVVTLSCSLLISFLPGGISLPVNALTPLFGVPVILYVLLSRRRKEG